MKCLAGRKIVSKGGNCFEFLEGEEEKLFQKTKIDKS